MEEGRDYPIIGTCVKYKGEKAMVFRLDVLAGKIFLASDEQVISDITLEEYSKLKVISIPDIEQCP